MNEAHNYNIFTSDAMTHGRQLVEGVVIYLWSAIRNKCRKHVMKKNGRCDTADKLMFPPWSESIHERGDRAALRCVHHRR